MRGGLQVELPRCELCGVQDYCNVSAIGSDRHVVLCNPHHREFLAACKEWLRAEQAKRAAALPQVVKS